MKTVELNKLTPKRVVITPEEAKEGIVVNFGKDFVEGELIICVEESKPAEKTGTKIKGHPNCVMGECLECHVVSCAIHQGFEEAEPEED
ncbi:MAG: hypothetical protein IJO08_02545 [Clostridia bacterium]|nr:hypothetical protein [Clostridia bacterium]